MLLEAKAFYNRVQIVKTAKDVEGIGRWFVFTSKGRLFAFPSPCDPLPPGFYPVFKDHMPLYEFNDDGEVVKFIGCSCGANVGVGAYDRGGVVELPVSAVEVELFQDWFKVGDAYISLEEKDGDVYVYATHKDDSLKHEALIQFRKDHNQFVRCGELHNDYGIRLDGDALYWKKSEVVPTSKDTSSRRVKVLRSGTCAHYTWARDVVPFGMLRGKDSSVDVFICDDNGYPLAYLLNISPGGMTMYPFSGGYGFGCSGVSGMNVLAHVRCPVDLDHEKLDSCPRG
jgi:hypothetical protein